jgi:hypothetical protein
MPQIIDVSYFQKANDLNIPLSVVNLVANPSLSTPNSNEALTLLCEKVEKSILLNALGLATYNTLQLALEDDFTNPLYASYEKLVKGEEYDGKIWNGLEEDYSLIAYKIKEQFLIDTNDRLSGVGVVQSSPEKANLITPQYKIASANQSFIDKYQKGYLEFPLVYENVVDWYANRENDIQVSLYQYMMDKKTDFADFKIELFKTYETLNSFGI